MERTLSFSVASVVEDVLQQHGNRLGDGGGGFDLESRRAEEAASRRNEASGWLRKMIGVVAAKDLPAEPSEEEFRLGLRSGIILCNVLNKVQPGAVPKVVESPCDSALIPDGAALSAFQYFENVRNFLVAIQEMGVPTFEASDLEQGGTSARVVNTVLALKSYGEWKRGGGYGVWKFGGNVKPATISATKSFVRKNSEPFTNSLSRTSSLNDKSFNPSNVSSSRSSLIRALLTDKRPEEIPTLVESLLSKLVDEVENRFSSLELTKASPKDVVAAPSQSNKSLFKSAFGAKRAEELNSKAMEKNELIHGSSIFEEQSKSLLLKQQMIFDRQQKDVQDLKHKLHAAKVGMQFMQVKFSEEFHNLGMHVYSLAHAASGYHKVLMENRKLYNQVQDLKGSIRVYCRVRPFLSGQSNYVSVVDHIEDGNITVNAPSKHGKGQRSFSFNKVFGPSATQVGVFADMQPLIRSVLDGYKVCIFAYGQTGSGKTFTMTGPKELTEKSQGVNYRALGDLFLIADQRKETYRYDVSVQMIEIYNEQVRDLLVTDGTNKRLEIRNSSQNGLSVPDASLVSVSSTSDVINLMNLGQRNRAVGATALNDRSSRSHSCLTVHVQGKDLTSGAILRGCMHLVDLAGSERVDKSEVTGDRLKEAQYINKSLSALGDVIASLAQKNPHVPYRNSKLTQLLQDSLGGQAKTLMFVHISPEPDAIGETLSTLKFAERVATVELGAARVNKDTSDVKELKEQIASLKATLARKEGTPQQIQLHVSGNSEKFKAKASELSPRQPRSQDVDVLVENAICRRPMDDVGNIEFHYNSALRQKRQSFDMAELLANSPPWPPVSSPCLNYGEDDKDTASGEWVDKVIDVNRVENPLEEEGCWEAENGHLNEIFYQKYLQDSSKLYTEQGYSMLTGRANRFNMIGNDDIDDAGTSDSSEPDLLWQFNHSKLAASIGNGIESKTKKPNGGGKQQQQPLKSPELLSSKKLSSSMSPSRSPSQKMISSNGVALPLHRNGKRQPASADKRRTGNRKQ
ncbi:kinesin-like protein KIN-14I isoform X2 [Cucurbita maxima]|uniref:Kinesin-like protein KIN-14I isoform X2 n=1 Tax=Cucurbita maxima TaxID=3661 RepID=A0A6J1KFD7_CUCMA|nr:kinesin-like protein KIN-14I isoform X2 [Cucurbita maxima]